MEKHWKALVLATALLLCLSLLCACQPTVSPAASSDAPSSTVVSLLYNSELPAFEALVESAYPDIDLEVERNAEGTINGELERRLRNDHAPDLLMTNLPHGNAVAYTYDLSAEPFSSLYTAGITKALLIDGQTRYLPLPGRYFGYIVNTTYLAQLGLAMPTNNQELLATLEAAKARSIGVNELGYCFGVWIVGDVGLADYIIGTYAVDFFSTADGLRWLSDMRDGKTTFTGHWEHSIDLLKAMLENGYINPDRLMTNADLRTTLSNAFDAFDQLSTGNVLMSYADTDTYYSLIEADTAFTFDMIPALPTEADKKPMVSALTNEYIGISTSAAQDERKLDACLRILSLLSTNEGQQAWMADTNRALSYLSTYETDDSALPQSLRTAVREGYVFTNELPDTVLTSFGRQMIAAAKGQQDVATALATVDDELLHNADELTFDLSLVGSVAVDMLYTDYNVRREETQLGNLVADAILEATQADVALVNSGGIRSSLYQGDVYGEDLSAVCPYQNLIIVAKLDGATLKAALANGISQLYRPSGRFLQVAGIHYTFRPAWEDGQASELLSVTYPDGTPVQDDDVFTVAYNNFMGGAGGYVESGDGFTMLNVYDSATPIGAELITETGLTFADALRLYFQNHVHEAITAQLQGRITLEE